MRDRVRLAIEAFRSGGFVVVTDDESRENEGDLIIAAELATVEDIGFMIRHTSGLICVPLPAQRLEDLALPMMVATNTESFMTAFAISVDLLEGTTTGISAGDRALTIRALADPAAGPADFARPGHVFPLKAQPGGILIRPGHTEAGIDLCVMSGLTPAAVLCELVNDDGSMQRGAQLEEFAVRFDLPMVSIAELINYRWVNEEVVQRQASARLPTTHGEFEAVGFRSTLDGSEHVALVMGDVTGQNDVLTRIHSECFTGDVMGSLRCDCQAQLDAALARIAAEGKGILTYNRSHEGRGIGLLNKLAAYALQDDGHDTVEANRMLGFGDDMRSFGIEAQILKSLKVNCVRLLTNNPDKQKQLESFGVTVSERVSHVAGVGPENAAYLETKRKRMGHIMEEDTP